MGERNSALQNVRAAAGWLLPLALAWLLLAVSMALSKQAWHWKAVPVAAQWPVEQVLDASSASCSPAPPANPGGLLARRVHIDLRPGQESLLLELDLADCSPRLALLNQTLDEQGNELDHERLATALFGTVYTGLTLRLGPPQLLRDAGGARRLRLRAQGEAMSAGRAHTLIVGPPLDGEVDTEVRVLTRPGDALWSSEQMPQQQQDGEAMWRLPAGEGGMLRLSLLPAAAPAAAASAPTAEPEAAPAPALLRALRGELNLLSPVWLGLNLALPFLLIGEWARRGLADAQPVGAGSLQALGQGCRLALLWIALLALSDSLQLLLQDLPGSAKWPSQLSQAWAGMLPGGHEIALAAAMVQVAIFVALLPTLLRGGVRAPRRGVAVLLLIALLLIIAALLLPGLLSPEERDDMPVEQALWAALPALLPASLCAALALALQLGLSIWHGLLPLLLGASLLLLLGDLNGHAMPLLAALFAIPLGLAYAPATRRWCPVQPRAEAARAWAIAGALLALLLALPEDLSQPWFYPWLLGSAAWSLLRLWQLPLMLLLLYWLAHCPPPRPGERLAPATRAAGGLLISFTAFWNANMPPLTVLLVGITVYFLLRAWLFAPRVLRKPSRRRQALLNEAINTLAAGQALRRARRDSRKGLQEQLGKGGLSLADWQGRQAEFGAAQALQAPALRRAKVVAMLALNLGGTSDPWRRGLQGAMLSTALALPWLLSYFNSLIAAPPPPTHAYALTLIVEVLLDVGQWPALGFFFLYFYPHLRGHNGMQKGLVLTLTALLVALPSALVNSASQGAAAWPIYLFWTLQVFICCMSLGVALGDLAALRRVGRGLGSLFEVYNLGVLAAWGSSLALAVGAGLTTVLASQASTLAAKGLEALLKPAGG